ncbi:Branched-chain amino acid aminotransferase, partial [human gut metagenome]
LLYIAEHYLKMPVFEREVFVDKLDEIVGFVPKERINEAIVENL